MNEFKFFTWFSIINSTVLAVLLLLLFEYADTLSEDWRWIPVGFGTIYVISKLIEAQD